MQNQCRRSQFAMIVLLGAAVGVTARAAAQTVTEFAIPTASSEPIGITAGPDGNLWFIELTGNKIGRIPITATAANPQITEFAIPTANSGPDGITAGPDGALWFTEDSGNKIGRITTAGGILEITIPTAGGNPRGITAGPDGNLWFTEFQGNKIGRITTGGTITEFAIPTASSEPVGITSGPDGNLWFTEFQGNKIGRIPTTATVANPQITEFAIATANSEPFGITAGPDGRLWFTEFTGKIGRITTAGSITDDSPPTATSFPFGITAGPDGAIWFAEDSGNNIGRSATTFAMTEYPIPTATSEPTGIAAGPDGNLWFAEYGGNNIGRITVPCSSRSFASAQIDAHDFNNDGFSDIAWRNTSSGDVAFWLMQGTSNGVSILQSSDFANVPPAANWSIVGQRDFACYGYADLLWRNGDGEVSIWLMNGTTISQTADLGNVPTTWSVDGTGDFNGDGYGDILWRNTSSGDVSIWQMNGTTVSQASDFANVPVASGWTIAGTGDFNGDGKSDILWRDTSSGDVAIWLMNGTTIIQPSDFANVPVGSGWTIVGTGDFNGDGYADILWSNTSTGDVAIWLMHGTSNSVSILQPTDFANVPVSSGWTIAETGDFNGDGYSDILWRNTSSGDVAVWLMSGTAILQASDFANVPIASGWTIQGLNSD